MAYSDYPLDILCKKCIEADLVHFWLELDDVTPRFTVEVSGLVNSERVCLQRVGFDHKSLFGTNAGYSRETDTTTVMVTCKEVKQFLAQDGMTPLDIIGEKFWDQVNEEMQRPRRFIVEGSGSSTPS
jgi:hypothetical protein